MGTTTRTTYGSNAVARAAGLTYRQLDYWERHGYLTATLPASGSGSRRRYTAQDVQVAVALAALARMSGTGQVLATAQAELRALPAQAWCDRVVVTPEGLVRPLSLDLPASGYLLDLGALVGPLDAFERFLQLVGSD